MTKKDPFNNHHSQKLIAQIQKFPVHNHKHQGLSIVDVDGFSNRLARLITHAYSAKSSEAKHLFYEQSLHIIDEAKQSITQSNLPDPTTFHLLADLNTLELELKKIINLLTLKP